MARVVMQSKSAACRLTARKALRTTLASAWGSHHQPEFKVRFTDIRLFSHTTSAIVTTHIPRYNSKTVDRGDITRQINYCRKTERVFMRKFFMNSLVTLTALFVFTATAECYEIGKTLLVKWSGDNYWYPATIVKVDSSRYFVKFHDGDEEWTTKDFMREDDIKKGDKIYCNYKGQGKYYPGKVTSRNGQVIHIKYDDGDEEDSTISFIRVTR